MDERIARAHSADEIIAALVLGLEEFIEDEPGSPAVIYELLRASRHSEEIRAELAELYRRWRAELADSLRAKEREGVVRLEADPEAVASMLFSLGDGFGIQVLSDPEWDREAAFELGVGTARRLLGAGTSSRRSTPRAGAACRVRSCGTPSGALCAAGPGIPISGRSDLHSSIGTTDRAPARARPATRRRRCRAAGGARSTARRRCRWPRPCGTPRAFASDRTRWQ